MLRLFSAFILLMGFTACQSHQNVLMQVSTLESLKAGNYDGRVPLADLKPYGDMGLGTFHRLDGEMILINGDFYQIRFNGDVNVATESATTPFAVVTKFEPTFDQTLDRSMTLEQLQNYLDRSIPDPNTFCMFYIRGAFQYVKARSVPRQTKPYPPLDRVVKRQSVFEFHNEYGTLVGLRVPPYMRGINNQGYHFHFLNEARNGGGHVLEATLKEGHIRADTRHESFHMVMPE
jgi:acetolactate decarboxylase